MENGYNGYNSYTDRAGGSHTRPQAPAGEDGRRAASQSGGAAPAGSQGARGIKGKGWMAVKLAVLAAVILFLSLKGAFTPDREISELENRSLQTKPSVSFSSLSSGAFMSRFESYMSDQIPGRDGFVSAKATLQRLVGKTEQNGVYVGKKGWLFEKPAEFTEEKTGATIEAINAFCDAHKIQNVSFMLVPNSTEIVRKRLPAGYRPESQYSQIEEIYSRLADSVDRKLDALTPLGEYESPEELYYRTDHHWTTTAAKVVFDSLSGMLVPNGSTLAEYETYTLTNDFSGTLASSSGIHRERDTITACVPAEGAGHYLVTNSDTGEKTATLFKEEKLAEQNKYEVFLGGNFSRVVIDTAVQNDRVLLMLKDSYANCFIPLLTPYYNKIIVVDARYATENVKKIFLTYDVTDIMFLYNVNTFLDDVSLRDVLA